MRLGPIALLAALGACGGGSDSCSEDEVEVVYLRGPRDNETVCKPKPAVCGAVAKCIDTPCIAAMYGYCESPYIGVACSDTFAPPIISCNP